jgi:hypothetical protein
MRLKDAALFALIGMILLTVMLAVSFLRYVMSLGSGAVAPITVLTSGIYLLASLGLAVFFFVFHRTQS